MPLKKVLDKTGLYKPVADPPETLLLVGAAPACTVMCLKAEVAPEYLTYLAPALYCFYIFC